MNGHLYRRLTLVVLGLLGVVPCDAGTSFEIIHAFDNPPAVPYGALVEGSDGALYGTSREGKQYNSGVVFKVNQDGSGFAILHEFGFDRPGRGRLVASGGFLYGVLQLDCIFRVREDGTEFQKWTILTSPSFLGEGLVESGGVLYGTAYFRAERPGVVFRVNKDGTGFATLHSFDGADGATPIGALIAAGGTLFGTTGNGGATGDGTVFRIEADGSGFSKLHDFSETDGSIPYGELTLSGTTLFGTTLIGGSSSKGVVFRIDEDGTGFARIHDFDDAHGATPYSGLIKSGGALYGTTCYGGANGQGVAFKVAEDGTGFQDLYDFDGIDGSCPFASLFDSGGTLLGTTFSGGSHGAGTVFSILTDGSSFANVYEFGGSGRNLPNGLVESNGALFGTTANGGSSDGGVVFKTTEDGSQFEEIHSFEKQRASPLYPLIASDGVLYGTTGYGVFSLSDTGTDFVPLHDFFWSGGPDGSEPRAAPVYSGGVVYGTCIYGGANDKGVLFRVSADGTGFGKLLDFGGALGSYPQELMELDGRLYGTTNVTDEGGGGSVYTVGMDGGGYTPLWTLEPGNYPRGFVHTNGILYAWATKTVLRLDVDQPGATPIALLNDWIFTLMADSPGVLFGTTGSGGAHGKGYIFKIKIGKDGLGRVTRLHDFDGSAGDSSTGFIPSRLVSLGASLYGVTNEGGPKGGGTVFGLRASLRVAYSQEPRSHFVVSLARVTDGPVTVEYFTQDGTATAGVDYVAGTGTVTFGPGEYRKAIHVRILKPGTGKTFSLVLSNATGAAVTVSEAEAVLSHVVRGR